jgi:hypothetical protein
MKRKMAAREKLEEARHFLQLLDNTAAASKVFDYYLSAYLSAWRSVLDVMLFDFAQSYSLGLNRDDRIDENAFRIAARALRNKKALDFLRWWRIQSDRISRNPLSRVRNMIVHRGTSPLGITIPITPGAPKPMPSDRVVDTFPAFLSYNRKSKQVVVVTQDGGSQLGKVGQSKLVKIRWHQFEFDSIPGREAKAVCKDAFKQIENIVRTAEKSYWRSPRKPRFLEISGYSVASRQRSS